MWTSALMYEHSQPDDKVCWSAWIPQKSQNHHKDRGGLERSTDLLSGLGQRLAQRPVLEELIFNPTSLCSNASMLFVTAVYTF